MISVGSGSFWQQDQNFWARSQQITQAQTLSSTVIDQMFGASSTLTTGLASIANQTALDRVNTALSAAVQGALNPGSTGSTASSSTTSTASSASSSTSSTAPKAAAPVVAAPATGTGTVPLTSGTPLLGLGFLTRGNFSVSDGTFTTTYQSTGTDTVGDLISAINSGTPGNALVHAWLNGSGNLVITSQNKNDTVTVSGDYAAALGFGSTNATFAPTKPPPISHPVVSSSTSATSGSASKSTATPASGIAANSALALQTGGTAELLLASSGLAGSIVNILA
jgi:alkylhydroperoxidase/carboxymuconolactone decarboxylase family protein YurZ